MHATARYQQFGLTLLVNHACNLRCAYCYTGEKFRDWRGDLLVGSLQPGRLVRLRLANGRVTHEERYVIDPGERIRNVRQGPDGNIYVLTDQETGALLRIEPVQ